MHDAEPSFDHVLWIGGGTGGGKTTAARLLAVRHGLRAFHVDAFWYAHDARLELPELDPEEQWLRRTPERQARDFEERARLGTALVLEDLTALPREPPGATTLLCVSRKVMRHRLANAGCVCLAENVSEYAGELKTQRVA